MDQNDLSPSFVKKRMAEMDERIMQIQMAIDSGCLEGEHLALALRFQALLKEGGKKWLSLAVDANRVKRLFDVGEISELERCKMMFGAFMKASDDLAELCDRKEALVEDLKALDLDEADPADWWKHGRRD